MNKLIARRVIPALLKKNKNFLPIINNICVRSFSQTPFRRDEEEKHNAVEIPVRPWYISTFVDIKNLFYYPVLMLAVFLTAGFLINVEEKNYQKQKAKKQQTKEQ
ncbi:hypothetical protein ABK040_008130 [Willaertia magna]